MNLIREDLSNQIESLNGTKGDKDNLDTSTIANLEGLKKSLQAKLKDFVEEMKGHQVDQKTNNMSLQQEISILKKDKLDLYQKVNGYRINRNHKENHRYGERYRAGL